MLGFMQGNRGKPWGNRGETLGNHGGSHRFSMVDYGETCGELGGSMEG